VKLTPAERAKLWREKNPEKAAANLARLRGYKRRTRSKGDSLPNAQTQHDSEHGGAQSPQPDAAQQRIAAQADMTRLAALASTLDAMIDKGPATVPMLRLRMDLARTLSVLRDRLRKLPEPVPVDADWLTSPSEPEPVEQPAEPDALTF